MNKQKIDLHPYGKYLIDFQDGDYGSFVGEGVLIEIEPEHCPVDTLMFYLPNENSMGYFSINDVKSHSGESFISDLNEQTLKLLFDGVERGIFSKELIIREILAYNKMAKAISYHC